jgi:SAM-dependent methyltransferase
MGVALCRDCGLVYTHRRLADDALEAFYEGEYRRLDRGVPLPQEQFFELERGKGQLIYAFMEQAGTMPSEGSLVLEVGCGAGGVLAPFAERGYAVLGVDPGSAYVDYGAKVHGLDLRVGDLMTARMAMGTRGVKPGLVIYEQVLEHLVSPAAELASVREMLGDAGLLYLGVPGLRNVDAHYDSDFLRYLQIPHLTHFELRTLRAMAEGHGFRLEAGNEVIRAVFVVGRAAAEAVPRDASRATDMRTFLRGLERRRRVKAARRQLMTWIRGAARLPLVAAVRMRAWTMGP